MLSNFAAKHIGKETYPPRPNTIFGFSFFRSKKEFIKAGISFRKKNERYKNKTK